MTDQIVFPRPLASGDTIAITSPASIIDPRRVEGACKTLTAWGYNVKVMPHALGRSGTYSGNIGERLSDISEALTDSEVRAIICSRGGYGCVHLLEEIDRLPLRDDPKWLVGFSDVSALHALMASKGIVSVHGSMAKALAEQPPASAPNAALLAILSGERRGLEFEAAEGSRRGEAFGRLMGGNLAVVQALMGTRFSPFAAGSILYIEDVAEPVYKVERILYQLRLSGILESMAGLIVGQFTEYRPDANHRSMEEMIIGMTSGLDIPVAMGAPIGHVDRNMPLLNGALARLDVTDRCTISYPDPLH